MNGVARFVGFQIVLVALASAATYAIGACTPAQRAEVAAADNFLCADVRPLVNSALASSTGEASIDAGTVPGDGGEAVELSFIVRATRHHHRHHDAGGPGNATADASADAATDAGDGGR